MPKQTEPQNVPNLPKLTPQQQRHADEMGRSGRTKQEKNSHEDFSYLDIFEEKLQAQRDL